MSANNIVLNSCQYTPVYFIENPGVSQARSFIIQPNGQNAVKPVSESLKRFYENSGKLESNLTTVDCGVKSRLLKKNDSNVVGNNLKLASFLLPKSETKNEVCKPILTPVNNVVLKPVYIANNFSVNNNVSSANQVPKLDVDSRLVKLSEFSNIVRSHNGKILPKIKPKENSHSTKPKQMAMQAIQPVQLVKLGETYHSVNQLTSKQMNLVNHALKMLNNTQTPPSEPAYDPVTNTKFIYKVVSQKDLAEKNKLNKTVVAEVKKEPVIKIEKPEVEPENEEVEEPYYTFETKMTRSGRIVKFPKKIIDDSPSKPKKKPAAINKCFQCHTKFASPVRLQRHYEINPTHLPVEPHTSLLHCLIAIVSTAPESERASVLLRQLEDLIDKLRSCVPCLLACDEGNENASSIGDEIGKLLRISPGKYNLNTEALGCEKDKDGYCNHSPRPQTVVTDKTQLKLEKIENSVAKSPSNILKVNLQERRPTILRKMECRKQKLEQSSHNENDNGKKMKLSQDIFVDKNSINIDELVDLLSDTTKTENKESNAKDKVVINNLNEQQDTVPEKNEKGTRPPHIQFHSAHFDIRSSPIKPTSTVFRKFQINPEKMTKYVEIIRPIQLNQLANAEITNDVDKRSNMNTQNILSSTNIITSKGSENLNYSTKNWCDDSSFIKTNDFIEGADRFMKPDDVIEPALLYIKDDVKGNNAIAKESVLFNVENHSKATNNANNKEDLMNSNIFTKESNHGEHDLVTNKDSDFMKSDIFLEPHTLSQHNNKAINKVTDQSGDFMKSDMLIEESLLNTQDCKVVDDITDTNDYMKSDSILIEPALIHNEGTKDFSDHADSFMTSNVYSNNENRVMDVTQNNEIDIDSSSNQGQSIISFLESLGNELAYSETDTRNNHVDFQLDLFSFNS